MDAETKLTSGTPKTGDFGMTDNGMMWMPKQVRHDRRIGIKLMRNLF
jgi:hypothetical protein